jgi:hypothetical protein
MDVWLAEQMLTTTEDVPLGLLKDWASTSVARQYPRAAMTHS